MTQTLARETAELRAAREMAAAFGDAGIPYMFGIPGGGSSIDLIEACRDEGIGFVLTQHETSAALMAVVCGELTGSCGVSISIMAPGAANLTGGAAYAFLERHPLLCITECYGADTAQRIGMQKIDHSSTFASTCKASITVGSNDPRGQIAAAIRIAAAERPGPVHVDLPLEVSHTATVEEPPYASGAVSGDLEAVADAVDRAARPIIIAGPVVLRQGAGERLVELAEKLQAAVMVTSKARGVIPEKHPLYAGVMSGVYREDTLEGDMMSRADLVLAVGLDRVELLSPWRYEHEIVAVDAMPVPEDERVGSPKAAASGPLSQLLGSLTDLVSPRTAWDPEELRDYWRAALGTLGAYDSDLNAASAIVRARKLAPTDTIVASEAGVYGRVNLYAWQVNDPATCFDSSGANTMGFSVPAAMAASLVRPRQKAVSLVGDGGFLMRAGELETAARLGLSPIIVIFDDGTLGMIRVKQRAKGYAREGVDMTQTDFVRLAESFGAVGYEVRGLDQFESAFKTALESDRMSVIDVRVDPDRYLGHVKPIRGL